MKIFRWAALLALVCLSGCCAHPGWFEKVHRAMETVQGFYEPLLQEKWEQNETLRQAVVAADTTLLLAAELQKQWCPDPEGAQQLQLQTLQASKLAQEAGVAAAADPGGAAAGKGAE